MRGRRYPVSMVLGFLAGNMTPEEILADYPVIEREDISACLALPPGFRVCTAFCPWPREVFTTTIC